MTKKPKTRTCKCGAVTDTVDGRPTCRTCGRGLVAHADRNALIAQLLREGNAAAIEEAW
jgi:hypothetical protein